MTIRLLRLFALATALFCVAPSVFAQGTAFTYQGRLNDGSGPANGTYDLTFALHSAANGATQVGSLVPKNSTAVSNGLFTVSLDFGYQFPGPDRWLEIGVRTNGEVSFTTLTPRQPLAPAPYAVFSANAATASTASSVAAVNITGTIQAANIGAGSISSAMIAQGAIGPNQLDDGAVRSVAIANGTVTGTKMAVASNWFAKSVTSPNPVAGDSFGTSVAGIGSEKFIVGSYGDDTGATDAGAAYLFESSGALLTVFTNPTPAMGGWFGLAVAALGNGRALVGAPRNDTGAAYLFDVNGALLTTFTNPTPAIGDWFGSSVAGVGDAYVLIGARNDDFGGSDVGIAYLFSTNGTLVTTFTNPVPTSADSFGLSAVAVGEAHVLIAAPHASGSVGVAYLFATNGTLVTTFSNPTPTPGDNFGLGIGALGSDRLIISAPSDYYFNGVFGGTAYLFSTNGTLLTILNNPARGVDSDFGFSVAPLGTDRILVGARFGKLDGTNVGSAYVFDTNGIVLAKLVNPTPAATDFFGTALAGFGTNQVLVAAQGDGTRAAGAGAVYLFKTETYTPGLMAETVRARSVTSSSLADGAVTQAKLDPSIGVWSASGDDVFRVTGKIGIGTRTPLSKLHVVGNVTATAFNPSSDRNAKENFRAIQSAEVLEKVASLPISRWTFKGETDSEHIGPMAQDFRAAFGLGADDRHIATVDADGVALAAIQGLNQKHEAEAKSKDARIRELEARLEKLERLMEAKGGAR